MKRVGLWLVAGLMVLGMAGALRAADEAAFTRQEDVIYGRKWGMALTLDVFTPKKDANGAGIIYVVSGGWFSNHDSINVGFVNEYLKRGYTVFAVVHGSQPKFALPEIVEDLNRSVRFIRLHAKDYKIDADKLGITGGSAGGHLSLMQGNAGDKGKADAKDPVEKTSSRIQAVACFFPPTDFLNWGGDGKELNIDTIQVPYKGAFDFHELDSGTRMLKPVTDAKKIHDLLRQLSPIYHVSAESPPTLIMHGDKDPLVPIQQAETIVARLKDAGVLAELVMKKDGKHGWPEITQDTVAFADWFDKVLLKKEDKGK
jgi:acetyl esterase/lipase